MQQVAEGGEGGGGGGGGGGAGGVPPGPGGHSRDCLTCAHTNALLTSVLNILVGQHQSLEQCIADIGMRQRQCFGSGGGSNRQINVPPGVPALIEEGSTLQQQPSTPSRQQQPSTPSRAAPSPSSWGALSATAPTRQPVVRLEDAPLSVRARTTESFANANVNGSPGPKLLLAGASGTGPLVGAASDVQSLGSPQQMRAQPTSASGYTANVGDMLRSVKSVLRGMDQTNKNGHKWRNEQVRRLTANFDDNAERRLTSMVLRYSWDLICLIIIVADAVLIGVAANQTVIDDAQLAATLAITCWYVFEIIVRSFRQGRAFVSRKHGEWYWNIIDVTVTAAAVLDTARLWITNDKSQAGLTLRLLRLLRVVRFLCRISDMRKLLFSMACSVMTLFWSLMLLLLLIFTFAVWFTQSTVVYLAETPEGEMDEMRQRLLEDYFGTMPRSMLSLYEAITNGKNWGDFAEILHVTNPLGRATFVLYICVAVMGILNVVTAVFVDSAMQASKSYKDLLLQEKELRDRMHVKHMKQIFHSIDTDHSGSITLEELVAFLSDDAGGLRTYFEALDVSARDTQSLFHLLDFNESGEVDIEEFCDGLMRLGGTATSFDLNTLMYDQRRTNKNILLFVKHLASLLETVRHSMAQIKSQQDRIGLSLAEGGGATRPPTTQTLAGITKRSLGDGTPIRARSITFASGNSFGGQSSEHMQSETDISPANLAHAALSAARSKADLGGSTGKLPAGASSDAVEPKDESLPQVPISSSDRSIRFSSGYRDSL